MPPAQTVVIPDALWFVAALGPPPLPRRPPEEPRTSCTVKFCLLISLPCPSTEICCSLSNRWKLKLSSYFSSVPAPAIARPKYPCCLSRRVTILIVLIRLPSSNPENLQPDQ